MPNDPKAGKRMSRGFTLIELMIVVAIIGVLAAIVIVAYQTNVAKSQMTAALAEIASVKPAYEIELHEEGSPGVYTIASMGLEAADSGDRCSNIGVNAPALDSSANPALSCTVAGHPAITGAIINLNRDAGGGWQCDVVTAGAGSWRDAYAPTGCAINGS